MSAYCLFDNIEVRDPAKLADYADRVLDVVQAHGGRYLAVGGRVDRVEGEWSLVFPVLIEFPDMEAARRWYDAPEYQELKALRQEAATSNAVFFETAPSDLLAEQRV
jgi:uncharacterized protein (DUF1330 family)